MTAAELLKLQAKHPVGPGVMRLNRPQEAPAESGPILASKPGWGIGKAHPHDKLNKTERDYYTFLETQKDIWNGVQNITLVLGHDCRLTMDFAAVDESGLRLIDTKGTDKHGKPRIEDDAWVKMRTAARLFHWIRFVIAWKVDGVWRHMEVQP